MTQIVSSWRVTLAYTPSGQPTTTENTANSQQPCKGRTVSIVRSRSHFRITLGSQHDGPISSHCAHWTVRVDQEFRVGRSAEPCRHIRTNPVNLPQGAYVSVFCDSCQHKLGSAACQRDAFSALRRIPVNLGWPRSWPPLLAFPPYSLRSLTLGDAAFAGMQLEHSSSASKRCRSRANRAAK